MFRLHAPTSFHVHIRSIGELSLDCAGEGEFLFFPALSRDSTKLPPTGGKGGGKLRIGQGAGLASTSSLPTSHHILTVTLHGNAARRQAELGGGTGASRGSRAAFSLPPRGSVARRGFPFA